MRAFLLNALFLLATGAQGQTAPAVSQIPARGNIDFDSSLFQPKIIGGEPARAGSYPWQVSLQRSDTQAHYCGASIRDAKWIVTAGHCAVNLRPTDVAAVAGTHYLIATEPRLRIQRIIVNKQYTEIKQPSGVTYDYDIALMMLDQPLVFGPELQSIPPVSAAEEEAIVPGTPLYVSGWGATSEGGRAVITLRSVSVPSVPTADCKNPFSYGGRVSERMLCAGDAQGGRDACQGDSGGPLSTAQSGTGAKLIGVASWGAGCARAGKPGVYARISVLNSWIEKCMASPDSCQ
jgi:secreted trypsin-like serine protease